MARRGADGLCDGLGLCGRCGLVPLCLLLAESEREDGRALGPHSRLPPLVYPRPRHHDPRDHAQPRNGPAMSRMPGGGRIDQSRPIRLTFNALPYQGYAGDTLASALLANDVRVVATSMTYR